MHVPRNSTLSLVLSPIYPEPLLIQGLQNHLRTMHNETLETVPNALANRSDPATVPDIQGMEGIPTKDLQEFKSRVRPSSKPPLSLPQFLQKAGKVEPVVKKAKVDAPLGAQEIQAQLAQFQKRKEQQEIEELKKTGIAFPPGLPESQALKLFNYRKELPPGTGTYATRHPLTLIPPTHPLILAQKLSDGKSDTASPFPQPSALPVSSNPSSVLPVTHSSSPSNAVVSKFAFFVCRRLTVDLLHRLVLNLRRILRFSRFRRRQPDRWLRESKRNLIEV